MTFYKRIHTYSMLFLVGVNEGWVLMGDFQCLSITGKLMDTKYITHKLTN